MSSNISVDAGSLLALVLEGVVYGFSILMFISTIWGLTYKQRMQDVSRPIAVVAILLFILSTAHIVVNTIRAEDALVTYADTFPGGPAAFFADLAQPTVVIKNVLYTLETLLADGVMIYRCYVVWQSVLIIILPSILWCGLAVAGVFLTYSYSHDTSNTGNIATNESGQPLEWAAAFFALTIVTNLLSSGLLAYRIWKIERNVSAVRSKKSAMMPIVRILIDAAALYTVVLFILLVCFICSNNGEFVIADMLVPTISITFYMILIRIALNRKRRNHSSVMGVISETERGNLQQYPVPSLQVQFMRNDSTAVYRVGDESQPSTFTTQSRKGSLEL